jgi:hypothetical protein
VVYIKYGYIFSLKRPTSGRGYEIHYGTVHSLNMLLKCSCNCLLSFYVFIYNLIMILYISYMYIMPSAWSWHFEVKKMLPH